MSHFISLILSLVMSLQQKRHTPLISDQKAPYCTDPRKQYTFFFYPYLKKKKKAEQLTHIFEALLHRDLRISCKMSLVSRSCSPSNLRKLLKCNTVSTLQWLTFWSALVGKDFTYVCFFLLVSQRSFFYEYKIIFCTFWLSLVKRRVMCLMCSSFQPPCFFFFAFPPHSWIIRCWCFR